MYYETPADKLLHIRANPLRVPVHQKLSNLLRGEMFVLNCLYGRDKHSLREGIRYRYS